MRAFEAIEYFSDIYYVHCISVKQCVNISLFQGMVDSTRNGVYDSDSDFIKRLTVAGTSEYANKVESLYLVPMPST